MPNLGRLDDPLHPVWSFSRLLVIMTVLCFVLWLNASEFDHTEETAMIQYFFGALGLEGATQVGFRWARKKEDAVSETERLRRELEDLKRDARV